MTFTEALSAAFNDGDNITRRAWNNRNQFVAVEETKLCIKGYDAGKPDDGLYHPLIVTEQDYFADDWEVVSDG